MPPTAANESDTGLGAKGGALLLVLTAALLLFRLGAVPLLGPDEPRYVRVAIEMHRGGEWVTPTLAGKPWLEKPVLYYWLAGACFSLFGETETAARLPSVVSAVLLVGFCALCGARLFGRASGLHAGFILATSLLPFAFGRAATMDMLLAAFVTLAIGFFALGLLGIAGRLAVPAAWLCMGIATLAKGPIGLLLPGLVVVAFALAARDTRVLRRVLSPAGIVLFLAVAGPWYALVYRAQGQAFVDVFLLNHNVERFTSTIHRHPGPFLYYVPILLAGLFPWSGLVLPGLAGVAPRRSRTDLFVLLWLLLPFAFFSVAGSKLPGYVLPCLPPLALLMGRAATILVRDPRAFPSWAGPRAVAVVGIVVGALVATTPAFLYRVHEVGWILLIPAASWSLIVVLSVSRWLGRDPAGAFRLLRVGGAGLLLLLTTAAPPILSRQQSGRDLFLPAHGREVLVWGAWRTAWMAGYFYNDGKVREVDGLPVLIDAIRAGPALVLAGPSERRQLEAVPSMRSRVLASDVRGDTLLEVEAR
jgi:4-amino-4-deoxy-L-arabinose transferase-like glycosyltransferase